MGAAQAALRFHFSRPGDGGLAAAERATPLDPDNMTMLYNFDCGFVRLREFDMARDVLALVLAKDTAETVNWAKVNPDLDTIRELPHFKEMMATTDARLVNR